MRNSEHSKDIHGKEFEPYKLKSEELVLIVESGILMWGYRVVIPNSLRQSLLN